MCETRLNALYIKAFQHIYNFKHNNRNKKFYKNIFKPHKTKKLPRRMTIPCEVACNYNDINISLKKQSPFYWTVKFV